MPAESQLLDAPPHPAHAPVHDADLEPLLDWVGALTGCPPVTHVVVAACRAVQHGGQRHTWFFAEASATAGIARLRCVACGTANDLLDSAEHWTFPPMHCCSSCRQSMVEVAVGLHVTPAAPDGDAPGSPATVSWAVAAAQCIACGRIDGLTDMLLPDRDLDDVLAEV